MSKIFHSVKLEKDKCKGCITCINRCPTGAIRVRNGKAKINSELCIDCGECIRRCPHHAKKAVSDSLDLLKNYKYTICLPAPSLYGQFNDISNINFILTALKNIGFDYIFEVSKAAELVSEYTREYLNKTNKKPIISSACPAVVRLIKIRFPQLIDNVLSILPPMELAAKVAKTKLAKQQSVDINEIGAFFISPCPAKVTDTKNPIGREKSFVDGVFSISDIYPRLILKMKEITNPERLIEGGIIGVGWASSGGEASALLNDRYLAADGIEEVIGILEQLEDEKLSNLDFIELNACKGGCVGGVLTVANPFVAKVRLKLLKRSLPVSKGYTLKNYNNKMMDWSQPLKYEPVLKLSDDMETALQMMNEIDEIYDRLPKLDCGACGAPTCKALAEDIVRGYSTELDCIFKLKEYVNKQADFINKNNKD